MEKTVFVCDQISKKPIGVFGDYDVDGATSAAMLHLFFNYLDIKHSYTNDFEGYGPNADTLKDLSSKGSNLIITVDCRFHLLNLCLLFKLQ